MKWVALAGGVLAVVAATLLIAGSDGGGPGTRVDQSKAERRAAAQEADQADAVGEDYLGDATSDPATEWCDSEKGDRVAQLDSTYNSIKSSPARVKKLQDSVFVASEGAPPGAYCVASAVDTLVFFWNNSASNSKAKRFKPREQVRKLRSYLRDGQF